MGMRGSTLLKINTTVQNPRSSDSGGPIFVSSSQDYDVHADLTGPTPVLLGHCLAVYKSTSGITRLHTRHAYRGICICRGLHLSVWVWTCAATYYHLQVLDAQARGVCQHDFRGCIWITLHPSKFILSASMSKCNNVFEYLNFIPTVQSNSIVLVMIMYLYKLVTERRYYNHGQRAQLPIQRKLQRLTNTSC